MPNSVQALTEQIAVRLKNYIIDNNLKPGEKIPTEQKLSEMMGAGKGCPQYRLVRRSVGFCFYT